MRAGVAVLLVAFLLTLGQGSPSPAKEAPAIQLEIDTSAGDFPLRRSTLFPPMILDDGSGPTGTWPATASLTITRECWDGPDFCRDGHTYTVTESVTFSGTYSPASRMLSGSVVHRQETYRPEVRDGSEMVQLEQRGTTETTGTLEVAWSEEGRRFLGTMKGTEESTGTVWEYDPGPGWTGRHAVTEGPTFKPVTWAVVSPELSSPTGNTVTVEDPAAGGPGAAGPATLGPSTAGSEEVGGEEVGGEDTGGEAGGEAGSSLGVALLIGLLALLGVGGAAGYRARTPKVPASATSTARPPASEHPDIEWTSPDGVNQVLQWSPEHGGYVNVLTGGMVDPAGIEGWKRNVTRTISQTDQWREHNRELEATGQDAQSRALAGIEAGRQAEQARLAEQARAWKQWYRDHAEQQRDYNAWLSGVYSRQAGAMDTLAKVAESTQWVADRSIDVLATVTGPPGKAIKTQYTVAKDVLKHVAAARSAGEFAHGLALGAAEAAFDVGWSKVAGSKKVQRIPGFGKHPGGKFSGESLGTIEKAITRTLATGLDGSLDKQEMVRSAFRDGFKNAAKSYGQKLLVKDPLKGGLGLK